MDIVIAGAGAVGTHLARMLSRQNHNITLIDPDAEKLENIESQIEVITKVGSCILLSVLRDVSVDQCDLFVAVNPTEELNINSAIMAKKLGAKHTVARVNNSEYLEKESAEYLKSVGVDEIIYPDNLAALEIVSALKQIGSRQLHEFSEGKLQVMGIKLWDNALILNMTLVEMANHFGADLFRVVAIKRASHTIIPRGNTVLKYGDLIYVVTKPEDSKNIFELCGKNSFEIKNIMIVGATQLGVKAATRLQDNYKVKLIEANREKCIQVADLLTNTLVINGDGRDLDLLREEGIKNTDAFLCLTDNSEANILTSLLVKKLGVKKSIARVENIDYIELAENIGIGTIINTKMVAASHIYRHTLQVDVQHLKFINFTDAEVFELKAEEGSYITKKPIKDLNLPENTTLGGVIHGEEAQIATGNTQIQAGDKVVVFALSSAVKKVIKLFQK